MTEEEFSKNLRRLYVLGQLYWQHADSESWSANKKADKFDQDFKDLSNKLLEEFRNLKKGNND